MIPNEFSVVRTGPVLRDTIEVDRNDILRIHQGCGTEVHVHQGTLWLTQDNDPKDRFLEVGERFRIDRDGRVIAQAFSDAVVTLMSPAHNRDLKFAVVHVPPPPARVVPIASDRQPLPSGAYGAFELTVAFVGAVWDAVGRRWSTLIAAKPAAPGGRHG